MRIIYSLFVIVQCAISALAQTGQFTDLTATRSLRVPIYADTPSFGSRGWVISTHDGRVWLRNFNNTSWLDITGTGVGAGLPPQVGNAGKLLTTNGTNPSWTNDVIYSRINTVQHPNVGLYYSHPDSVAYGDSTLVSGKRLEQRLNSHSHTASQITSGVINPDRLATGTRNGTNYLRDDGTWQPVYIANQPYEVVATQTNINWDNSNSYASAPAHTDNAHFTYTIPANTFNVGDRLEIEATGRFLQNSGSAKVLRWRLFGNSDAAIDGYESPSYSNSTASRAMKFRWLITRTDSDKWAATLEWVHGLVGGQGNMLGGQGAAVVNIASMQVFRTHNFGSDLIIKGFLYGFDAPNMQFGAPILSITMIRAPQ